MKYYFQSGRQDSNLRPPGPKPGAMTGLRYAPRNLSNEYIQMRRDWDSNPGDGYPPTDQQSAPLPLRHLSVYVYELIISVLRLQRYNDFSFLASFSQTFFNIFYIFLVNSYLSNTQYLHIFILEKIYYLFFYTFSLPKLYFVIYFILNVEDTKQQNIKKLQAIVLLGVFRYLFKFVSTN